MNQRQISLVNEIPGLVSEVLRLKETVLELKNEINAINERISAKPKRGRPRKVDAVRRQDKSDMRTGTQ